MALGASLRGHAGDVASGLAATPQAQAAGFGQTAFIFGVVAFAFVMYVTLKGDLPKWFGLFGFAASSNSGLNAPGGGMASAASATPGTNSAGATLPDVLSGNYGNNVVPFTAPPVLGTLVQ